MDPAFWVNMGWLGLALVHIITPFVPFAFPVRVAATAFMATEHSWLLVVLVADAAWTTSMIAQYCLYRWAGSERWIKKIEHIRLVQKISASIEARMFVSLICLISSPIPDTLLPLVASAKRYSVWKFAIAMFIGRLTHIVPMALGGISLKWLWRQLRQ